MYSSEKLNYEDYKNRDFLLLLVESYLCVESEEKIVLRCVGHFLRYLGAVGEVLSCSLVFDAASVVSTRTADWGVTARCAAKPVGQFAETAETAGGRVLLQGEDAGDDERDFTDEQCLQGEEADGSEEER